MLTSEFLTQVSFFVMAAIALFGAFLAVAMRNLVRAALGLILSFMGVAGLYFILEAEFVGVIQILVYVGAISILILFAIMLTRGLMTSTASSQNSQWIGAALISVLMFVVLGGVVMGTNWAVSPIATNVDFIPKLGTELMTTYLLPFEAVSLLLLAALIGAIVIAREEVVKK
jgi:NADH:ubiquinone oxidoreductase subunit 6 (subunit J)